LYSIEQKDKAVRYTFRDRLLDPMQYDAFLKAFNETGSFSSGGGSARDIQNLEQATLPVLQDSLSNKTSSTR